MHRLRELDPSDEQDSWKKVSLYRQRDKNSAVNLGFCKFKFVSHLSSNVKRALSPLNKDKGTSVKVDEVDSPLRFISAANQRGHKISSIKQLVMMKNKIIKVQREERSISKQKEKKNIDG